jgi:hypothetical protein
MSSSVDLWVSSAKLDFQSAIHEGVKTADLQTAVHHGVCFADLPVMCCQIEDMVQSVALGLNELSEALLLINQRLDQIDARLRAQSPARDGLE